MDHIYDQAIIEYRVPLRFTFDPLTGMLVERDVREHQMRDDRDCLNEPSSCPVGVTRDLYARVRWQRFRSKGEPGLIYFFPTLDPTRRIKVLLAPDWHEVIVEDRDGELCRCNGLIYHDHRRIRTPLIDLSRADARLQDSTLELLLPRVRP